MSAFWLELLMESGIMPIARLADLMQEASELKVSIVDRLADEIAQKLQDKGVTLGEMLRSLREGRERYYEEHYTSPSYPIGPMCLSW